MTDTVQPELIEVTEAAVRKVKALLAEEENPDLHLRVFVTGGGCSGFQYGFSFDAKTNDGDLNVCRDGIEVVIDPLSLQYLMGSKIDYTEGLQGARFVVENPNATTTCGCGSSFSV